MSRRGAPVVHRRLQLSAVQRAKIVSAAAENFLVPDRELGQANAVEGGGIGYRLHVRCGLDGGKH